MRTAQLERTTKETEINLTLDLDGNGTAKVDTTLKFLDHMLVLLAKHSQINLELTAHGDLNHHLVEDIGICLGQAFLKALGDKKGIERYGEATIPMDEVLVQAALDFSGRTAICLDLKFKHPIVEDVSTEDLIHFLQSFGENARMNLHVRVLYGENDHHKIEGAIKALARAIKQAKKITSDEIMSTKGVL